MPGCSNWLWLDLHHVKHREHGGSHEETNLVVACNVHHRMAHTGRLEIRAENGGFWFVFPDGRSLFVKSGPSKRATRASTPQVARDQVDGHQLGVT